MSAEDGGFRAPGGRKLSMVVARLARQTGHKRGFAVGQVLTHWFEIAGDSLAGVCVPERLTFPTGKSAEATLTLRVAPGFAPLVQHRGPQIIDRINGYYGYRAIGRLKLIQAPLPPARRAARRVAPPPLPPQAAAEIEATVAGIGNAGLRGALAQLGREIKTRTRDSCG